MNYKMDTDEIVCFYEQEFYVLSNFSSFAIEYQGEVWPTSEHLYHSFKFPNNPEIRERIRLARSAHDAYQIAQRCKAQRREDWDVVKCAHMLKILRLKVAQHPYVKTKLIETRDRVLVEDSWRDDYWGWGPEKNGQNMLGVLWAEVREEVLAEERP